MSSINTPKRMKLHNSGKMLQNRNKKIILYEQLAKIRSKKCNLLEKDITIHIQTCIGRTKPISYKVDKETFFFAFDELSEYTPTKIFNLTQQKLFMSKLSKKNHKLNSLAVLSCFLGILV